MTPEQLIAITAPKASNLSAGALTREPTYAELRHQELREARHRPMVPAPRYRSDYTPEAPKWGSIEAGMACKGLDERFFFALLYTYAGDDSVRGRLERELHLWAVRRFDRSDWPERVETFDGEVRAGLYLLSLSRMHFHEERYPHVFMAARRRDGDDGTDRSNPGLAPALMRVAEHVWARHLSPIYETMRDEYRCWISIGRAHMRDWLDEDLIAGVA